jgi:hypothetical protein
MEKVEISYDKTALVDYINANAITVPILIGPFTHKVIHAELVLVKAQELCGASIEEFQKYINGYQRSLMEKRSEKYDPTYKRDEFLDKVIGLIEYPGVFATYGWEKVGNKPYIYLHKLLDK